MSKHNKDNLQQSNFNLTTLNTGKLETHLDASTRMGSNAAVFGRRGTGKTEIAKQVIASAGFTERYINLSVLERVDLGGYPDIMAASRGSDFVNFILPDFYEPMINGGPPGKDGKPTKVVALLDEVDKAAPDLWAPLLEFVQFKSINSRKLPYLQSVIMTGNLLAEGGSRPSLPLLDRAEKYLVEPDLNMWMTWAGKRGNIHPSITAYINDHHSELFGNVDPEDRYADPSPRGWTNASRLIHSGEELGISNEVLVDKVSGCVGQQSGLKFKMYYDYYKDLLPLVDKIFKGENVNKKVNALDLSKKLIVGMITCSRFANQLDAYNDKHGQLQPGSGKVPDFVKYVGRFAKEMDLENALVALRSQIGADRFVQNQLDEAEYWGELLESLNDGLMGV